MATTAALPEQCITLYDVSWKPQTSLLTDQVARATPRFTCVRGTLEIRRPGSEHERANRALSLMVELIAAEHDVDVLNVGSMTCERQDEQCGFEPDSSFYIQRERGVRAKIDIDLAVDPPLIS